jgi:hypothetical protein
MDRRTLLGLLSAPWAALVAGARLAEGGPRGPLRRHRRRVMRRVRRRIRRRVVIRAIHGRPVWVVPVGLVAGWELVHENRVGVVREMRFVPIDGGTREVAIVDYGDGKTDQVEVVREDTAENRENLSGSVLPDNDRTTPGVESEIEDNP